MHARTVCALSGEKVYPQGTTIIHKTRVCLLLTNCFTPVTTTPFNNMPPKFNAASSSVSAETIQDFLEKQACDISINDVPGVGPALCSGFREENITTCAQLLAKFLVFCEEDADAEDVCQNFFDWVKSVNSHANAHNVTFAIANYADKKGLFKYEI